ncbi:serine acetyltransferase [candidate division KSB1 bacterium]|nr:serine acetyltransferase [candidate division KSB1 bacterium]
MALLRTLVCGGPFKYSFWMRSCQYLDSHSLLKYTFFPIAWLWLHHLNYKFGISISYKTQIGSGFYIGHYGGIVVNSKSIIGKNVNISHGVTLGLANRGRKKGVPTLGDNIYLGPGAKIVGAVTIGNNVAIGANCVVTRDIPDNAVVIGIPGRVISQSGAKGYIVRTDYEDKIKAPSRADQCAK